MEEISWFGKRKSQDRHEKDESKIWERHAQDRLRFRKSERCEILRTWGWKKQKKD